MSQPIVIDCRIFAREARDLQGELPVASLARTHDLLVDHAGVLRYRLEGRLGSKNRPQLLLELGGVLLVRCQRCLEVIRFPLEIRSVLEFVESEEELTQEEMEDDSKDFLTVEKEFDVAALIEDEIILDLPAAPRHESCELPGAGQGKGEDSPFLVLKGFKGRAQ